MKKLFFLFLIFFSVFPYLIKADSSKIYHKGYTNPMNVLGSFLWDVKKKGKIFENISCVKCTIKCTIKMHYKTAL